ncbi:phage/plasmid primase, P4 family [Lactococcus sp. SK2-659]|uniref:DNA primase family protein n=1 Tax=Lactococcus sp. SK2-659 TaxID=2879150 RepID=UPI001CDBE0EE|nr:phage/plasmid primase, P4 family [Lactococcus sp. SK2-659]MCA2382027.1 phage/plasmid primase, P4 family [Lactococcus sp. SK2-659]
MTDQLEKLVAETPQENVRSPKPKIEDFTEYKENGIKTFSQTAYTEAIVNWIEQERDIINSYDYIQEHTQNLKKIKKLFFEHRALFLSTPNKDGNAPKSLSPLDTARIIYKTLKVIKLDHQSGLLGVYNPELGIYETNENFFHRLIYWLEPSYSQARSKEVLFKLETLAEVKQQTAEAHLIPVANGIFNKKTQQLEPFNAKYVFTSTISTRYNARAEPPNINGWDVDSWLLDLMSGDKELVSLLWQIISASTNGNYSYRKGAWLVGKGNDGKGTFQSLIMNLIGRENVASVKAEQFSERFSLSQVVGKTCIIGDDSQVSYLDNAGNYFSVVTGDPVPIEAKGKQPTLAVFNKLVIQSTNFLPKFRNKSNGTYRRLLIVPFEKSFTADNDNWKIKDDYIKRKDVLEYVLKIALSLNFEKFDEPKATQGLLNDFKISNDNVLAFVNDMFEEFVSDFLPTAFLSALYRAWCEDEGVKPFTKREFELKLPDHIKEEWEKTSRRPSGAGFNRAIDLHRAEEYELFRRLFHWDEDKQKSMTKGYLRKKKRK